MRQTFVVLVWFHITSTTFHARITTRRLYLSKLYLKHYWFHFFRTRCISLVFWCVRFILWLLISMLSVIFTDLLIPDFLHSSCRSLCICCICCKFLEMMLVIPDIFWLICKFVVVILMLQAHDFQWSCRLLDCDPYYWPSLLCVCILFCACIPCKLL